MKVMVNKCWHGFTISEEQKKLFPGMDTKDIPRNDPALIASFEAGDRRGDGHSSLAIFEIPDTASYVVVDVDGFETLYWSDSPITAL